MFVELLNGTANNVFMSLSNGLVGISETILIRIRSKKLIKCFIVNGVKD